MRFKRHIPMELEHGLKQIDIAPLIDMVFQLLIFFMLTSTFIMQSGIKVNLPKAVTSEVIEKEGIEISISAEDIIYLNGRVVTLQELRSTIRNVGKRDLPILIKADKRASLGRIVDAWDICREEGISNINIATTQE